MSALLAKRGLLANRRLSNTIPCGLLLCAAAHTLDAQPYFSGIGTLHDVGFSLARCISDDGIVVLGDSVVFGHYANEVVYWTREDGMVSLTPGVYSNDPGGSNGDGTVLGGNFIYAAYRTTEAFRWTLSGGAVGIGDLPGGEYRSGVRGASARGDVLVGYSSSEHSTEDGAESFLWTTENGMIALGGLPGSGSRSAATASSANGKVIVGGGPSDQGSQAYRWTVVTGMVGLGDFAGGFNRSTAKAASADGSVIIGSGWDEGGQRGFRWTAETGMVALPKVHPTQAAQRAYGISWDGNVIVGEAITAIGLGPFYWTAEEGIRWLADVFDEHGVVVPDGWRLVVAYAVSADGRTIVGNGINPQGNGEGWVAYLGPGCRADFDDDGTVDAEDVAAYLTAWLNRSIFTDWDYDGYINTRDLLAFLNEWVAKPGCP